MATVSNRKLAVVTGASSGIGYALAEQCVKNGFDVMICADSERLETARQRLETSGAQVYAVLEDLSTPEGVERLYQRIVDTGRHVDALLLNAGVGLGGAFLDTPLDRELRMIALNCGHTVHLAKRVLSDMVAMHSGRVLITGSIAGTAPTPFQAIYGATKAFVYSFGEALREELEGTGVTVTTLEDAQRGSGDAASQVAKDGFQAMLAGKASVFAGSFANGVKGALTEVVSEYANETKPGASKR
ncbi:MAG: SDR family NAD(P)-dependent oxidoreductase [Archangium sp.]|nr:SDR family NAD(P)-dependent oxidoreductase [Archangium sp.]